MKLSKHSMHHRTSKRINKLIFTVLFILYVFFIIYATLLNRKPTEDYQYNFQLFWSYARIFDKRQLSQTPQIVNNILFFIPFGILLSVISWNGNWKKLLIKIVLVACVFSGIIEALQLFFKLGFAELDDVFDNTLGAALGAGMVILLMEVKRELRNGR